LSASSSGTTSALIPSRLSASSSGSASSCISIASASFRETRPHPDVLREDDPEDDRVPEDERPPHAPALARPGRRGHGRHHRPFFRRSGSGRTSQTSRMTKSTA
jgi:hypothetical protein